MFESHELVTFRSCEINLVMSYRQQTDKSTGFHRYLED